MKYIYIILCVCLAYLFTACEPKFDLNAPYKDVTVVYGILNYQDSIHYIKIYKGFQSNKKSGVYIDAQNPDSIYYKPDELEVRLEEWKDNKRTSRPDIPLMITHDFPRDTGFFYFKDERILYLTKEPILKGMEYKIVVKNKITGKIVEGTTPIVEDVSIMYPTYVFVMTGNTESVGFKRAKHAVDYEVHVNFLYFEVDKKTNQVVKQDTIFRNMTSSIGEFMNVEGNDLKKQITTSFFDDIANHVKPNDNVVRYIGSPNDNGICIQIVVWAAGNSLTQYLLSNQNTSSFVQVNTLYSNLEVQSSDGLAFGFLSSRVKAVRKVGTNAASQDSLVHGSKTGHLGFRPWIEYKP